MIHVSGHFYVDLYEDEVDPGEEYLEAIKRLLKFTDYFAFTDVMDDDDNVMRPVDG